MRHSQYSNNQLSIKSVKDCLREKPRFKFQPKPIHLCWLLLSAMAYTEFESKRIEKAVRTFVEKRRTPPHIRSQLDLAFRLTGQSVEIFEIRPRWRGETGELMERPVAKATCVKTQKVWKIFWMRQDLKWHGYPPEPMVETIEEFLSIVNADAHGCFFG